MAFGFLRNIFAGEKPELPEVNSAPEEDIPTVEPVTSSVFEKTGNLNADLEQWMRHTPGYIRTIENSPSLVGIIIEDEPAPLPKGEVTTLGKLLQLLKRHGVRIGTEKSDPTADDTLEFGTVNWMRVKEGWLVRFNPEVKVDRSLPANQAE